MTAPMGPLSLLYAPNDDPSRTPQRSSSLSYKGHSQASARRQQQRSPLLGSNSMADEDEDDEIALHTRPASFAAPPSASSRYNPYHHPSLAAMMDASHLATTNTGSPGGPPGHRSPNLGGPLHTFDRRDPTPSTSRLPYNSDNRTTSNNIAFPSHTSNAITSTQYSQYQQQEQPGQSLASVSRDRQGSNGSGGSNSSRNSSSSRYMHSTGNSETQTQQPSRRKRSVENSTESLPASSSLSIPTRQFDNSSQASSTSSNTRSMNAQQQQSSQGGGANNTQQTTQSSSGHRRTAQLCAKCNLPMTGQFVRALGTVFHLDCFRCQVSSIIHVDFFHVSVLTPRFSGSLAR